VRLTSLVPQCIVCSLRASIDEPTRLDLLSATPLFPGLSHVAEEFEEEGIVPSGALELTPQRGGCIRMGSAHVEGQASEHGKVGRSVVLAITRQILIERDVERPVQAVFDRPGVQRAAAAWRWGADRAAKFCGRPLAYFVPAVP
jgi:hypothetical protein